MSCGEPGRWLALAYCNGNKLPKCLSSAALAAALAESASTSWHISDKRGHAHKLREESQLFCVSALGLQIADLS